MPISFRTDFKILLITVKALCVLAPEYIHGCCSCMQTSAQPQILGQKLFTVPIARLKTKGGRCSESSFLESSLPHICHKPF